MSEQKNEPTTGGLRFDDNKLRLDLVPAEWELELGRVNTAGSKKYAARNWEKGMKWMKMIGCMRRHVLKFMLGESYDKETGCHHLALAAWNLLGLMSYDMRKLGEDDRPPSVKIGPNFERVPDDVKEVWFKPEIDLGKVDTSATTIRSTVFNKE